MKDKDLRYVVRRKKDGLYFTGCGYGGPGKPVPYWHSEMRDAKLYKYPLKARAAAERFGGELGFVYVDKWCGEPTEWKGWIVETEEGQA